MLGNNQKLRTTRIPRTLPMRQMPIALRGLLCVGFIFAGTFFRAVFGVFQAACIMVFVAFILFQAAFAVRVGFGCMGAMGFCAVYAVARAIYVRAIRTVARCPVCTAVSCFGQCAQGERGIRVVKIDLFG